jgi:myosin-1
VYRFRLRGATECRSSLLWTRRFGQSIVSGASGAKLTNRYNNLFEWIVSRVNVSMKPQQASQYVIGVLDI